MSWIPLKSTKSELNSTSEEKEFSSEKISKNLVTLCGLPTRLVSGVGEEYGLHGPS